MRLGRLVVGVACMVVGVIGCYPPPDPASVRAEVIADGLQFPAMFTFDERGRIFFAELKAGAIRILDPASSATALFFTVPDLCTAGGDQGLLGLAVHPDYPAEPFVYAYATRLRGDSCQNELLRITGQDPLGGNDAGSVDVLWSQPYIGLHIGGRLAFGPDGLLYLTTGEGGDGDGGPTASHSQDPNSGHGKILRFTDDGSVPSTNPVAGSIVYASGFRNVFGSTFHPDDGALWVTENGPACNDEINRIVAGGNYGWGPNATCQEPPAPPANTNQDGPSPILPAYWYPDADGQTGITVCAGCGLGPWTEGKLLYAHYDLGEIHALTLDSSHTQVRSDTLVYRHSAKPLSLESAPDGRIYFSDLNSIYRLHLDDAQN